MNSLSTIALLLLACCSSLAGCGGGSGAATPDVADLGLGPDLMPPPIGPAGRFDLDIDIDGVNRTYILYVPESAVAAMATGPVPLLIPLHGAGDDADNFMTVLRFPSLADKNAFVLAVPDGYNHGWFVQPKEGWGMDDGQPTSLPNDLHFLQAIIDATRAAYFLDPRRYYVCGLSRGAGFTGIIASASNNPDAAKTAGPWSSPFAAYGVSAGYDYWDGTIDFGKSMPRRPIWIMHGDADNVVPESWGEKLATELMDASWPTTFTVIPGAPHDWLWRATYGHSNQELWDFFAKNPIQ